MHGAMDMDNKSPFVLGFTSFPHKLFFSNLLETCWGKIKPHHFPSSHFLSNIEIRNTKPNYWRTPGYLATRQTLLNLLDNYMVHWLHYLWKVQFTIHTFLICSCLHRCINYNCFKLNHKVFNVETTPESKTKFCLKEVNITKCHTTLCYGTSHDRTALYIVIFDRHKTTNVMKGPKKACASSSKT